MRSSIWACSQSMPRSSRRYFQAGTVAVVAVAVVALGGDDRLDHVAEVGRWQPRDGTGQQRVRVVGPVVGHPHAAAGEHHEPGQLARRPFGQRRHDADVVRVHVDAVVARPGDPDLELARQVGLAVDRLDLVDRGDRVRAGVGARTFGMPHGRIRFGVTACSPSTHAPSRSRCADGSGRPSRRPPARAPPGGPDRGSGQAITLRTTSPPRAW